MPNIMRTGGGGGSLKISAKLLPDLPDTGRENDIVVIGTNSAPEFVLDATPPEVLQTDGVFVKCGEHDEQKPTITICAKPAINLTLLMASQKSDLGVLDSMEGYVYKGGKYLKFSAKSIPASALPDSSTNKILIRDSHTKYYDKPIIWRLADRNHYSVDPMYPQNTITLISEYILTFKPFDGREPNNPTAIDRYPDIRAWSKTGSNRYLGSNILQWLNSDGAAGEWYTAQHEYDEPPAIEYLMSGVNNYVNEAGFLNGFSQGFKAALMVTKQGVVKPQSLNRGYEYVTSKIMLPSIQEVGGNAENISVSACLETFKSRSNASRIVFPTEEALRHASVPPYNDPVKGCEWLLRTPKVPKGDAATGGEDVHRVMSDGYVAGAGYEPYDGTNSGIRPTCSLPNDILLMKGEDDIYDILWR